MTRAATISSTQSEFIAPVLQLNDSESIIQQGIKSTPLSRQLSDLSKSTATTPTNNNKTTQTIQDDESLSIKPEQLSHIFKNQRRIHGEPKPYKFDLRSCCI